MRRDLPLLAPVSLAFAPAPVRTPKAGTDAEDVKPSQGSWLAGDDVGIRFDGHLLTFSTRLGRGLSYRVESGASSNPKSIDMTQEGGEDDAKTCPRHLPPGEGRVHPV
jgi:hypothetical protein